MIKLATKHYYGLLIVFFLSYIVSDAAFRLASRILFGSDILIPLASAAAITAAVWMCAITWDYWYAFCEKVIEAIKTDIVKPREPQE